MSDMNGFNLDKEAYKKSIINNLVICYVRGKYILAREMKVQVLKEVVESYNIKQNNYQVYYDFLTDTTYTKSALGARDKRITFILNLGVESIIPYLSSNDIKKINNNTFNSIDLLNLYNRLIENNFYKNQGRFPIPKK